MHKIFLSALLLCTFALTLSAQKIYLGPELGVNLSPVSETGGSQNYQLGVNAGLRADFVLNDKISIGTGIFYAQKQIGFDSTSVGSLTDEFGDLFDLLGAFGGVDLEGLNLDINQQIRGTVTGSFIEIPLLFNFREERINFSLGGYAAVLVGAESRATVEEDIPALSLINLDDLGPLGGFGSLLPQAQSTRNTVSNDKDAFQSFDYGLRGSIAYVTENNLSFTLAYRHGLQDYRTERPAESDFTPWKNLMFTVGYLWGLEKKAVVGN